MRVHLRARICSRSRNYILKLPLSSSLSLSYSPSFSVAYARRTRRARHTPRRIISTDRTCARYFDACRNDPSARRDATRRGTARRESAQSESKFPLPPTLPSAHLRLLYPSGPHPPSRAINERVIDARSVNRLLPFINSPGRRAVAA